MDQVDISNQIGAIKFGILSPKLIRKMSVVKAVTPELYDKEGYPVDGGLMDVRMGVIDPGIRCKTCGSRLRQCPGHFGYIELARPVIHVKFVNLIQNVLNGSCSNCGRVLMQKVKIKKLSEDLKKIIQTTGIRTAQKYIEDIASTLKTIKKCPHCNANKEKVFLEKPYTFVEKDRKLNSIEIRARLEKVPDNDLFVFGLNPEIARPEWLILTILPIPPVTMRPSITLESGSRSEDDLTHKLGDIVRINQRLFENINAGAPELIIEDLWELLQYHVTTFFDNSVSQLPPARHRSGQPLKTIIERIKSKEGRIRENLMGKRTNFSARSVISPDPMLELDEVGVPYEVALKLTIPETVTEWNTEYLKKFVQKGSTKYPGANYIIRPDGRRKKVTEETKEALLEEIQPGYQIERHLLDGDTVLFNRYPSLHRMSMMAHRVRVLPHKTMRLNPAVCAPYNADFDGDAMNLHVPQTEESRTEAEFLMSVTTQIISPRHGLSIIGLIQDAISGLYLLTKDMVLTKQEVLDILTSIGYEDFSKINLKKEKFHGKEVIGVIFPRDFNFTGLDKSENKVVIKNGELVEGALDKANLGEGSGLLLRNLGEQYGSAQSMKIIGYLFRLGIEILQRKGFSCGLSDYDLSNDSKEKIRKIVENSYADVNDLIEKYRTRQLEAFPGKDLEETLDLKILERLNGIKNEIGKIIQTGTNVNSGTNIMITSGGRGNILNLIQMAGMYGQQALRGKRIIRGYKNRTLSCFKENDLGPEAHGFVESGFKRGLKPSEFFFAMITGRDSLMDVALRTPTSGYLYRRLANALRDLIISDDSTVRDLDDKIIQFEYGEDSVDVSKSEGGKLII